MRQRAVFDVNYLSFLLCAAIVACIALVTNSAAVVFASMLLSPLMDPIMCLLFGLSLRDSDLIKKGIRNGLASLLICILVGFFFGIPAHFVSEFEGTKPYPTAEMVNRGKAKGLISSAIVAFFSGVSVAFATLHNSLAALIGNAISLSLLPPAVNSGLFLFLAVLAVWDRSVGTDETCEYTFIRDHKTLYFEDRCSMPQEFICIASLSFLLTCLNIIVVVITGYMVNKIKDLAPRSFTNNVTRTFYKNDIKEFQKNYACLHKLDAQELAQAAFIEYAKLQNPDKAEPVSLDEAQKLTNDFESVLEGIKSDPHLNAMTVNIGGDRSFLENFRRASMNVTSDMINKVNKDPKLQRLRSIDMGSTLQDSDLNYLLNQNTVIGSVNYHSNQVSLLLLNFTQLSLPTDKSGLQCLTGQSP
ncbi:hypothetical protein Ciccas_004040 [Cichlidogyrus casuarinus]|uniref:DUF389 domain-containing protein n=1 Tax=Cichlidogyrus casuarinus TaxID=1844966 RepID=A0ABD2QCP8_9PLAT